MKNKIKMIVIAVVLTLGLVGGAMHLSAGCNTTPCGGKWYYCSWHECGGHQEIYMCCKTKPKY